jgi:Lon-like ATP-dependent protease
MTLELPKGLAGSSDAAEPLVAVPPADAASGGSSTTATSISSSGDKQGDGNSSSNSAESQSKTPRRDTGVVESGDQLETIGTLLQVVSLANHPNGPGGQIVVMPTERIKRLRTLSKPSADAPFCAVYAESIPDVKIEPGSNDIRVLHHEIIATMKDLLKTTFMYKDQFEQVIKYYNLDDPLKLADLVAGMSMAPRHELQGVLVEANPADRLRMVLMMIKRDLENARLQSQFKTQIEDKFAKEHRKYMLMQHLRHIKRELNLEKDDKQSVITAFKEKISTLVNPPEESTKAMEQELSRLSMLDVQSSEFNVSRTYLEWLTSLPWGKTSTDNTDISKAEQILN